MSKEMLLFLLNKTAAIQYKAVSTIHINHFNNR